MLDNIAVDRRGHVLLEEDPGEQNYVARIWQYDTESDTLLEVAHHDQDRFAPGVPNLLTLDEESSGIIPARFLGEGWYLLMSRPISPRTPSSWRAASCSRSSSPSSTTTATSTRRTRSTTTADRSRPWDPLRNGPHGR